LYYGIVPSSSPVLVRSHSPFPNLNRMALHRALLRRACLDNSPTTTRGSAGMSYLLLLTGRGIGPAKKVALVFSDECFHSIPMIEWRAPQSAPCFSIYGHWPLVSSLFYIFLYISVVAGRHKALWSLTASNDELLVEVCTKVHIFSCQSFVSLKMIHVKAQCAVLRESHTEASLLLVVIRGLLYCWRWFGQSDFLNGSLRTGPHNKTKWNLTAYPFCWR
jgi:hypothetical protein